MLSATLMAAKTFLAGVSVYFFSRIDTAALQENAIQLFIMGRVPLADVVIEFEALFAGVIFAIWLIATYNFTVEALLRIHSITMTHERRQKHIEELAL